MIIGLVSFITFLYQPSSTVFALARLVYLIWIFSCIETEMVRGQVPRYLKIMHTLGTLLTIVTNQGRIIS